MAFGLKNASATFQQMMVMEVLAGLLHEFIVVYLDDILVFSKNIKEHIKHLRVIFERVRLHRLRCAPNKCQFAKEDVEPSTRPAIQKSR